MNCHSTRAVLDLLAEGRLKQRRASAASVHLASCASCRALAAPAAAPCKPVAADFKARLASSLKAARTAPAAAPAAALELSLWPREFHGVALAAAALALVAVIIGWSGVPSQRDYGDELAAGRVP